LYRAERQDSDEASSADKQGPDKAEKAVALYEGINEFEKISLLSCVRRCNGLHDRLVSCSQFAYCPSQFASQPYKQAA
jgi:hypothetical protein